ncbi:mechanosensitive ion channel domain-containing protein [Acidocella sp.]|uniref:mechanosensitive ion channel family protein n=1 Tax=Acidocella sp. TaxID=50710 RepID=UPI003D06B877
MRILLLFICLALLAVPGGANATQPATSSATASQAAPAEPAKATPTIIPGSPLAALTGAAPPSQQDTATPAPFGTSEIGFAITTLLGQEATRTFDDFSEALRRSTRLAPVVKWIKSFPTNSPRRANGLAILSGIAIAILPGIALELLLRFLLRRPAAACARHARAPAPPASGHTPRHPPLLALLRRLGFALLKFCLMLVPLAIFAAIEQFFLSSGLVSARAAHLAIVGIVNAYLVARLTQEVLRLILAPGLPSLRLLRLSTGHANWAMRRALVLIVTIFTAFCLISVAEILGLPKDGADVLIRLAALAVHLEVALGIWQSRKVISRWIAGRPGADGLIAKVRQGFSRIWYIFALFYVLALWVAWAGGVHNALGVLLRAIVVVIAALILGGLAWQGSNKLLARIFPDSSLGGTPSSSLLGRARTYNPLIRFLIRAAIGLLMLMVMLQGWGVDVFSWLLTNPLSRALLNVVTSVLVTVAIAIVLWELVNFQLDRRVDRLNNAGRTRQATRLRTLTPMLRAAFGVVIVLVTLIICLSRIGVNTTGLLAVSSVVGIAVGFGSQKLVQDIITGLFLLFEDAMQVGDVVTLGGMSGTVERLSIRTIRLRGFDGSVNIIPFSSVTTVTNQTRDFSYAQISIMVGYHEDTDRVTHVLKEIGTQMREDPTWGAMMRDDLEIFGLDSFEELGLVFTGRIRTGPGQHWAVRREFYRRVQKRFSEEGIVLPYRHQTLRLERLDPPAGALGPG